MLNVLVFFMNNYNWKCKVLSIFIRDKSILLVFTTLLVIAFSPWSDRFVACYFGLNDTNPQDFLKSDFVSGHI